MKYTPNPPKVVEEMLQVLGLTSLEDLFSDIKPGLRLETGLNLPAGQSEMELHTKLKNLAAQNLSLDACPSFLGAGAYDHYFPAALEPLLMRSEFYTAYTPYQPEISQGILQAIFEYQSMICRLTGMEVANASLYDGGSALAEACNMAFLNGKGKHKIIIADTVHPEHLEILRTYALSGRLEINVIPGVNGVANVEAMLQALDVETAGVVIQQPNFYGLLEDPGQLVQAAHKLGALMIMHVDPISLAVLKPPGEWGADIAVGEGQPLGNSLSFGGPYLGFMATTRRLMRKIPGRIVGLTRDLEGRRAFVLTLQAREQHIRRERATSNICSNQALCALAASIYLTLLGEQGLTAIARRCHHLAGYAALEFAQAGLKLQYDQPYFREFVLQVKDPEAANQRLLAEGIMGGYPLKEGLLLAFTEKRTKTEIDRLVAILGEE